MSWYEWPFYVYTLIFAVALGAIVIGGFVAFVWNGGRAVSQSVKDFNRGQPPSEKHLGLQVAFGIIALCTLLTLFGVFKPGCLRDAW